MAKKEKKQKGDVIKVGDRYECTECHSEVPIKKACPVCKTEIDWDRIFIETRR
jgi:hypothetical protein